MKNFSQIRMINLLIGSSVLLSACEDVVDVDLNEGFSQLVVDAFLNDQPGPQAISLLFSQPYFENTLAPPALGATVTVTDNEGNQFFFLDEDQDGRYVWTPPSPSEAFGKIGNAYRLDISLDGEQYFAESQMNRVPVIDSLTYEFEEEELGNPAGYYAQVYARDLVGQGDTYWIRTYKNERFLNQGSDINIAFDAGFDAGANVDGLIFIRPIREGINPFREDDGEILPPYDLNDSIYVEIWSVTQETFFFLDDVRTQLTNEGLFAVPTANVRTNIVNANPNATQSALGFFSTSAVSSAGIRIRQE